MPLTARPSSRTVGAVAAISPDGQRLAVRSSSSSGAELLVHDLSTGETRQLAGTGITSSPFFSHDGRWLLFLGENGQLRKIPVEGGPSQTLADARILFGAEWTTDDRIVYTPNYSEGLWTVSADGGPAERLTTPDPQSGELGHWWPDVLPDGSAVIYTEYRVPLDRATVAAYSFASGERTVLVEGATNGRYVPTGHLLYFREGALQAVRFDPDRLEVLSSPAVVADGIAYVPASSSLLAAASDTGTLMYWRERDWQAPTRVISIDRQGSTAILDPEFHRYSDPALSPDGRRLAVAIDDGVRNLWVLDLERGTRTRATSDPVEQFQPMWTPSGEQLVYAQEDPDFEVYRIRADGTGQPEALTDSPLDEVPGSIAPDGTIAFVVNDPESGFDIWVLDPAGDSEPRPFRRSMFGDQTPSFSPDGRWLAYTSNDSRRDEVYVEPFPGPGARAQISTDGGSGPVWARDGGTLYYWRGDTLVAADVDPEAAFEVRGETELLTVQRERGSAFHAGFDAMPGGGLAILEPDPAAPPLQLQLVLNWFDEVARRVPPE